MKSIFLTHEAILAGQSVDPTCTAALHIALRSRRNPGNISVLTQAAHGSLGSGLYGYPFWRAALKPLARVHTSRILNSHPARRRKPFFKY
jgi:hypothetical protein